MATHPILFQGDMVLATMTCSLCGTVTLEVECPKCGSKERRKTQTRRVAKVQPPDDRYSICTLISASDNRQNEGKMHWCIVDELRIIEDQKKYFKTPYGVPGDLLWVREGFRCTGGGSWKGVLYRADGGDTAMSFCGVQDGRAKTIPVDFWPQWDHLAYETTKSCEWRPSIHMPKWACRNWLKVTGNRVARVQDISKEDVAAEGVIIRNIGETYWRAFRGVWDSCYAKPRPRYHKKVITHYESWPWAAGRKTVEHRGKRWEVYGNPWVSVTEFERTER